MLKFSEILKDLMTDMNININNLSKALGIHYTLIYKWFKSDSLPNFENLVKLIKYLDCTADFLLGRTNENHKYKIKKDFKFSESIKFFIKIKNKNIHRISKELNISRTKIYSWLNDKQLPYTSTLIRLADYFDCTVDEIMGLE